MLVTRYKPSYVEIREGWLAVVYKLNLSSVVLSLESSTCFAFLLLSFSCQNTSEWARVLNINVIKAELHYTLWTWD